MKNETKFSKRTFFSVFAGALLLFALFPKNDVALAITDTPTPTPTPTITCTTILSGMGCTQVDAYTVIITKTNNSVNTSGEVIAPLNTSIYLKLIGTLHYDNNVNYFGRWTPPFYNKMGIYVDSVYYTPASYLAKTYSNPNVFTRTIGLYNLETIITKTTSGNLKFQALASCISSCTYQAMNFLEVSYGGVAYPPLVFQLSTLPPTPTATPTSTATLTPTATATFTQTPSETITSTSTLTPTDIPTFTPTSTPTYTLVPPSTQLPPRSNGSGICWSSRTSWFSSMVYYDIDSSIPPAWIPSIEAAAQTWNNVDPSHLTFARQIGSGNIISYEVPNPSSILADSPYPPSTGYILSSFTIEVKIMILKIFYRKYPQNKAFWLV
jgi:hypothetical protein